MRSDREVIPTANGAKQRPLRIVTDAHLIEVGGEVGFKVMVAGHGVRLASFLPQTYPEAAVLREDVLDLHAERRTDPREGCQSARKRDPLSACKKDPFGTAV